jgi:hypothetical protein
MNSQRNETWKMVRNQFEIRTSGDNQFFDRKNDAETSNVSQSM